MSATFTIAPMEKVREIRDADDWRVLAWCLMGNHYHLVINMGATDHNLTT